MATARFRVSDNEQLSSHRCAILRPAIPRRVFYVRVPPHPPSQRPNRAASLPKCGKDMMISRIMPDRPGYDLRTYECAGAAMTNWS
jgi:hypothetical protein